MRQARWELVESDDKRVVIRDIGPWDKHPSVTNNAEEVAEEVSRWLHGRRLFYYDSEGALDELVIKDGKFKCFGPGPREKFKFKIGA